MNILCFRKLTRCWEFHTQFQCWRTVDGEKWKWTFGVGLSCSFVPGPAFLILLASLLQNQRLGYAAGNLGTELEAAYSQVTIQVLCGHAPEMVISERRY